jgi:uncharacterized membrane protein
MFHSTTGLVHLIAALLAMLTGAIVLLNNKGGLFHKRMGYAYVASMLTLNVTAFMIYHLFGKFGPFHALSIVSLTCIIGGMVPVLFRRQVKSWMHWHYYFMNWSVVGLYAAFWAETFTRTLPVKQFWLIVVVATTVTMFVGSYLIRKNAARFLPTEKPKKPRIALNNA